MAIHNDASNTALQKDTQQTHGSIVNGHTKSPDGQLDIEEARRQINLTIEGLNSELKGVNQFLHSNPETGYQEFKAHDHLTSFLEGQGFTVKRHTYGLETSFEAEIGTGGRLVIFCAEYDALPGIGHACGHNLIATSSLGAFLGAVKAWQSQGKPGRIRILGTPAEEGGGGKVKLIDAGAFKDEQASETGLAAAAIMAHPFARHQMLTSTTTGLAGMKLIASQKLRVEFRGKTAHAGGEPWNGINALDAAVAAYNNISMLRQQIRPDERIHGVVESGGTVPNVITEYTRMNWYVRSPTLKGSEALLERVKRCFEAAGLATGCTVSYNQAPTYADLVPNHSLSRVYVDAMAHESINQEIDLIQKDPFTGSTDMGNVSHLLPSFHGCFSIVTPPGTSIHNPVFAAAAGTDDAHQTAIDCAKGMAMIAVRVLGDDKLAKQAWVDFREGHQ